MYTIIRGKSINGGEIFCFFFRGCLAYYTAVLAPGLLVL